MDILTQTREAVEAKPAVEFLEIIRRGLDHISNCSDACGICREIANQLLIEMGDDASQGKETIQE